jgi:hypothetical protein
MFSGCTNQKIYHFYSPKNDKGFTVINEKNYRYIIDGYHNDIPNTNYVKVNLDKIDLELGDEIAGCWDKDNLKWSIVMNNVTIMENRLDKNKFRFKCNFPRDKTNIPTLIEFDRRKMGCFSISFDYGKLRTVSGTISQ